MCKDPPAQAPRAGGDDDGDDDDDDDDDQGEDGPRARGRCRKKKRNGVKERRGNTDAAEAAEPKRSTWSGYERYAEWRGGESRQRQHASEANHASLDGL